MGDWFQTIGDVEAAPDEVEELAAAVIGWLIEVGVVAAERTDCVLGSDLGYPPGPNYADAVTEPDSSLSRLWTNGLEVLTGRTVFDSGQGDIESAECPYCNTGNRFVDDRWEFDSAAWGPFAAAIDDWYASGDGRLACPACAKPVGLNEWRWKPDWGFGHLGFTFWNWPVLAPSFVAEFSRRLGHRVVCTGGKL
jgi:hypothetical protein